jgi:hypothetical protein
VINKIKKCAFSREKKSPSVLSELCFQLIDMSVSVCTVVGRGVGISGMCSWLSGRYAGGCGVETDGCGVGFTGGRGVETGGCSVENGGCVVEFIGGRGVEIVGCGVEADGSGISLIGRYVGGRDFAYISGRGV